MKLEVENVMRRIFSFLILISMISATSAVFADEATLSEGKALVKKWGCNECHGLSGNNRSTKTREIPMLAGQPAVFLAKRLVEYKAGDLNHLNDWSKMGTLVQGLNDKDIKLIAAWYEAQKRY